MNEAGDELMLNNENLVCKSLEQVNLLKDFFEFIFAKKIPSKNRSTYFKNENELDSVKKVTAKKELIRSEWCTFIRKYVDYIMAKVTQDGKHICRDRNSSEIIQEIADFVHRSMFYSKSFLVYQESGSEVFSVSIPPVSSILHDIKRRMSKNKGNLKYYELKGKLKRKQNNKERSKQGSDTDESDKENEINIINNNNNSGGDVL